MVKSTIVCLTYDTVTIADCTELLTSYNQLGGASRPKVGVMGARVGRPSVEAMLETTSWNVA